MLSGCFGSDTTQPQHSIFPLPCKTKTRAYYVDENGAEMEALNTAIENENLGKWFEPDFFQDGLLKIDITTSEGRKCKFLDADGNIVLDVYSTVFLKLFPESPDYAKCTDFSQGIAFVRLIPGTTYAIDKAGNVVFELAGEPESAFNSKGQAFFRNSAGHIGIFSKNGKILVEPKECNKLTGTSSHPTPIEDAIHVFNGEDETYTLQTFDGKNITVPMRFKFIPDYNGYSVMPASGAEKYAIVDKDGTELFKCDYRQLENDGKLYFFENPDREFGWCDATGKIKIGPLKPYSQQIPHGRIDPMPNLFYGSKWSVGTQTSVSDGENLYWSGCMTADDLQDMADNYDGEFDMLSNLRSYRINEVMISPMVNGRCIGINMYRRCGYVYHFDGKGLAPVNDENAFAPKYQNGYFRMYGMYALDPTTLWEGF